MARVHELDGWESGRTDQADAVVGTPSIVTSPVYGGDYALRINPAAAIQNVTYPATRDTAGLASTTVVDRCSAIFRMRIATMPSAAANIFSIMSGATVRLNLQLSTGGVITWGATAGSFALSLNTWYIIAVEFVAAGPEADIHHLTVLSADGSTVHERLTDTTAVSTMNTYRFGTGAAATFDIYFDDFASAVNNTTATPTVKAMSQYIGPGNVHYPRYPLIGGNYKVTRLDISRNGTTTGWTGDFTNVDENPTDDSGADVVSLTAAAASEEFGIESAGAAGVGENILGVKATINIRSTPTTSIISNLFTLRTAGVKRTLSALTLTIPITFERRSFVMDDDPGSGSWKRTILETMEVGFEDTTVSGADALEVANVVVQVVHSEGRAIPLRLATFEGFESGRLGHLVTIGTAPTIVTSPVYSGEYAIRCTGASNQGVESRIGFDDLGVQGTFGWTHGSILVRVRIAAYPSSSENFIGFGTDCHIELRTDGTLDIVVGGAASVITTVPLALNTWYVIAIEVKMTLAVESYQRVQIWNGAMTALHDPTTHIADGTGSTNYNVFYMQSTTADVYFDDFVGGHLGDINAPMDFPLVTGNYGITRLDITGAGAQTGWTGDNTNVDEIPTDDSAADVISTLAATTSETFALEDAASGGVKSRPLGVKVTVNKRESVSATTSGNPVRWLSNSQNIDLNPADWGNATFSLVSAVLDVEPDKQAPWTETTLNALEVGVNNITAEANVIQVANIVVQVLSFDAYATSARKRFGAALVG